MVTADHELTPPIQINSTISLTGIPHVSVRGNGITEPPVIQGTAFDVALDLYDEYNYTIDGATIIAYFFGKPYTFTDLGNGTYIANVPTENVPGGIHSLLIEVNHDYLERQVFRVNVTVIGNINLEVTISPDYIEQESTMEVRIVAVDDFGYPIIGANVRILFANETYTAENIRDNIYVATINVGKIYHGEYPLTIEVNGQFYTTKIAVETVYVYPKIPKLDLSPQTLMTLLGISMGVSFVGLSLYYGISSKLTRSLSVDERQRLLMSFKPLDLTYFALALLLFGTLGTAGYLYIKEFYELAVAVLGLALMELLLVYGIWLYRDAAYTLVTEKMSIKRAVASLWHIVLAPMIVLGIFEWGANIEWFAYYLLGETINLGVIELPSLYVSLLGTYITSIIVLVANIYLNSRRLKNRFREMRVGGTPEKVINEEKIIQLGKMSSSIRIKFFGFLVILGASLVSTTPLLQYYQLGVVVVLPLIFIVVIPYIVSKILGALGFTKRTIERG
jgi:hypothetical protein